MSGDDETETTLNVDGLTKLLKAFSKMPVIKIGVLAGSTRQGAKGKTQKTNAYIGAVHEFGSPAQGIPARSWLRVPITTRLDKRLLSANALDEAMVKEIVKTGSLYSFALRVAVFSESIVLEGFATGGFGEWKRSNMARKKNHQTLVETQQLRDSVTSEVKE